MKPGSVIVDVAIDQGGCFETSRPTTHADPVYVVDGVMHYCVANMPGGVPRTSTFALNNATLPFVLALAGQGLEAGARRRSALAQRPQRRVRQSDVPAGGRFSSDAIPAHLITAEAVALYASRLKPRGIMAFHVSSRFFNLPPVLARIAENQRLVWYVRDDKDVPPDRAAEAMRPSVWVLLARSDSDLGQLARSAPRWVRLVAAPGTRMWTDDYTNVLSVLQ